MGRHENDGFSEDELDQDPPRPRGPRAWPMPLVAAAAFTALLAALMWQIQDVRHQLEAAQQNSTVLADQVRQLGGVPAVTSSPGPRGEPGVQGNPGPTGSQGPRGATGRAPTDAEIKAAVTTYLRDHPPPAGQSPTTPQIAAAVADYLAEHPPSPGPRGEKGEPGATVTGPPGDKGERGEQGEQGPPPTTAQIEAAVEAWLRDHPVYCYPPDVPGQVAGQPWRCTIVAPS